MSQGRTARETQPWEMQLTSSYPHFGEGLPLKGLNKEDGIQQGKSWEASEMRHQNNSKWYVYISPVIRSAKKLFHIFP